MKVWIWTGVLVFIQLSSPQEPEPEPDRDADLWHFVQGKNSSSGLLIGPGQIKIFMFFIRGTNKQTEELLSSAAVKPADRTEPELEQLILTVFMYLSSCSNTSGSEPVAL